MQRKLNCNRTFGVMRTLCCLELFRLTSTADAAVKSPERDDLFMIFDVTEI